MKNLFIVLAFVAGGFFGYVSIENDLQMMKESLEINRQKWGFFLDQDEKQLDQLIDHAESLQDPAGTILSGNILKQKSIPKYERKDRSSRSFLLEQRKKLKDLRERLKEKSSQVPQENYEVGSDDIPVINVLKTWEKERVQSQEIQEVWADKSQELPENVVIQVLDRSGSQELSLRDVHVAQISAALSLMPQGFEKRLKKLYLVKNDPKMSRRGMSGPGVVFVKEEHDDIFAVLLHEFGHVYDFYSEINDGELSDFYLGQYRFFQDDPSIAYYDLSWEDAHESDPDPKAYASGYGMSKYYEDFAEAFVLYVLQNKTFSQWALENTVMAKKYDYMRSVFENRGYEASFLYTDRPFDVTKMGFDLEDLL
ncbi:MAG: hypothetical protein P1V18_04430 [Candidatus Gracilibacteria bacterium]|nr:hypothetical protein [Candidatus Gracilibacteria bacterium]